MLFDSPGEDVQGHRTRFGNILWKSHGSHLLSQFQHLLVDHHTRALYLQPEEIL